MDTQVIITTHVNKLNILGTAETPNYAYGIIFNGSIIFIYEWTKISVFYCVLNFRSLYVGNVFSELTWQVFHGIYNEGPLGIQDS